MSAKYTIDFGEELEIILDRLVKKKNISKAEILRRAIATYNYLLLQEDLGLTVFLIDKQSKPYKIVKGMVLP